MTEFITLTGHTDHYSVETKLDEHATSDEAVQAFAHFLLGMGYAVEAVAASLEKVSHEL
jgi:hypothetical protein